MINNLVALGIGRLVPVTVVGDDGQAFDVLQALERLNVVDTRYCLRDPSRLTPTYTKPLKRGADGAWHELNRLDLRNRAALSSETLVRVRDALDAVFDATDGLIVLDQVNEESWGVVAPAIRDHLAVLAKRNPAKLIFVDSRAQIAKFRHATLKPNVHECLAALGREPLGEWCQSDAALDAGLLAARDFAALADCPLFCTLGHLGMAFVAPGGAAVRVPGYPISGPVDTVGAGDSATAGIVSALLSGAERAEAAAVGNLVASITVQQLGTTGTATPQQVLDRWDQTH